MFHVSAHVQMLSNVLQQSIRQQGLAKGVFSGEALFGEKTGLGSGETADFNYSHKKISFVGNKLVKMGGISNNLASH